MRSQLSFVGPPLTSIHATMLSPRRPSSAVVYVVARQSGMRRVPEPRLGHGSTMRAAAHVEPRPVTVRSADFIGLAPAPIPLDLLQFLP